MKSSQAGGGVLTVAGVAAIVLSIINRDGGATWMPIMLFLGLLLLLVAVVLFTYDSKEAAEARERLEKAA